ncbi:hypothetical protein D9M69_626230 [compost metagenome]
MIDFEAVKVELAIIYGCIFFDSHASAVKLAISDRNLKRLYLFRNPVMFEIGCEQLRTHQNTACRNGVT